MCLLSFLKWGSIGYPLRIIQWDFTRWDHSGNPRRVSGSGPVKASMSILLSLLPLQFVLHLYLSFTLFIFSCLIFSISSSFIEVNFSNRDRDRHVFGFVFFGPDQTTPAHQSSVRPLNDSNVAAIHSTVSHFLCLNLLSPSTSQKDVFYVALAVLLSASKAPQSKVFI